MSKCDFCSQKFIKEDEVWITEFGLFHAHECFTEFCCFEFHYDSYEEGENENKDV